VPGVPRPDRPHRCCRRVGITSISPGRLHDRDRQPVSADYARDRRVYRVTDPEGTNERAVVTVTGDIKRIANGITARVVYAEVSEGGERIEDNRAWYAQDGAGNVWYLGERARELANGQVKSTKGSWESGVDGTEPGVIMPARPEVGLAYRKEHYAGVAEDRALRYRRGAVARS
jgi:hypothetical protein